MTVEVVREDAPQPQRLDEREYQILRIVLGRVERDRQRVEELEHALAEAQADYVVSTTATDGFTAQLRARYHLEGGFNVDEERYIVQPV